MSSANHMTFFLILLISTFLLFSFPLLASPNGEVETEIEKVSGKDNVERGKLSIAMLTKLRILFALRTSSYASKNRSAYQLSPAQAPAEALIEITSPLPSSHKLHIYHIAPLLRRRQPPLFQGTEHHVSETSNTAPRKHLQIILAISVSFLATLAIFGIMTVLMLAHRRHRRNDAHCNTSNKVSFDPEQEMFYLDSLAPFFECDSDRNLSSELKNTISIESIETSPLQNERINLHFNLDSDNHLKEAANYVECLSSDGNESFHSICCSHCSNELTGTLFEQSLDCSPAIDWLSPSTSSRIGVFSSQSTKTSICSTNSMSSIMSKTPPPLLSDSLDRNHSQLSGTLSNESNIEPLPSSQSPNLEVAPAESWSSSKDTERSKITEKASSESRNQAIRTDQVLDIMNSTRDLQRLQSIGRQQIPKQPICNGSIPKPPPLPPTPPPFSLTNHKRSSLRKPAGPPFRPQQSQVIDKDGNPLPKLKALHWNKVSAAPDRSMVWDQIGSSSFV